MWEELNKFNLVEKQCGLILALGNAIERLDL